MSLISIENVSVTYGKQVALSSVSLNINAGDYIGLIGPNGAGKTTLIKTILGFIKPQKGRVVVQKKLNVGYVPQHYSFSTLIPISVFEVLSMSGVKSKAVLTDVLEKVDLSPEYLFKNFNTLSGGQKQRVIIARALCTNPDLLIFDEPLSNIDYETKLKMYALLSHLNEKYQLTILFVSHEVNYIISKCHHIVCLNKTIHSGCHPLDFAQGNVSGNCTHNVPSSSVAPVHHHHA